MSFLPTIGDSVQLPARGEVPRMDPAHLRGFEKLAVPLVTRTNTTFWMKDAIQLFVRHFSCRWVTLGTSRLWDIRGLEHVRDLDPPRGVILVSNHRSFFDMYVTSAALYRYSRFMRRLYFPVRANYFYDRPIGLLINMGISGGAMWPPVFRDARRETLNPVGLEQMRWILEQKGTVLGMHPEGTRCREADPYAFLPPKPGIGQLLKAAHPDTVVLPFFIAGLDNDVVGQVSRNFRPKREEDPGIRITFGAARRVGAFDLERRASRLAEDVMGIVRDLGELDRAARAAR